MFGLLTSTHVRLWGRLCSSSNFIAMRSVPVTGRITAVTETERFSESDERWQPKSSSTARGGGLVLAPASAGTPTVTAAATPRHAKATLRMSM